MDSQAISEVIKTLEKTSVSRETIISFRAFRMLLKMMNDMLGMVTAFISFVAGISLLVGGIRVMNIMLLSVTETKSVFEKRWEQDVFHYDAVSGGVRNPYRHWRNNRNCFRNSRGYGICSVMSSVQGMTITPELTLLPLLRQPCFLCGDYFLWYLSGKSSSIRVLSST